MSDQRAILATVTGRVQGVGFRYSTQRAGSRLGLTGWVRNEFDGTVSAWAQGPTDVVAGFIEYLSEGPPSARVTDIAVQDVAPDASLDGFRVR